MPALMCAPMAWRASVNGCWTTASNRVRPPSKSPSCEPTRSCRACQARPNGLNVVHEQKAGL